MRPLGAKQPEAPVLEMPRPSQDRPIRPLPPPTGGPEEPHLEWARAEERLGFPKPLTPGCLQTAHGGGTVVRESFLRDPGPRGGDALGPRTLDLTCQRASNMPEAAVLPEGPREATRQPPGTEPEDTEGLRRSLGLLEHQLWGDLPPEGPPLRGDQGKERLGGEEVDEDRDIDESSPQDSPPSQVSPTPGGPSPSAVSREATGVPACPVEGAILLPVDFLSKVPTEPPVSEPHGPGTAQGHEAPPEFTFHVEIRANRQKEQGRSEVDLEGAALPGGPGEEPAPRGPSEGEDIKKTDLPEPPEKQPAAGLPGKPVSRVPQLKGLCPGRPPPG